MYRTRVYLSGPITQGDRNWNQYQSNVAHKALIKAGYAVLNPMPTGVLPFAWDGSVEHREWIESDLAWIEVADMVLRLPGASKGGDTETDYAMSRGIPVYTIEDFDCLRGLLPQWEHGAVA
jgi:nucleoside 2-deoxyribosyltransferase